MVTAGVPVVGAVPGSVPVPVGPPLVIQVGSAHFQVGMAPSERQWIFLKAAELEQLYGGAKSGGKSWAIADKIIALGCSIPGNRIGLFRKDLTDLRDSTLTTFFKVCPPELILNHHRTHRIITLRTSAQPTEIIYGGLGDQHEIESAKGKEFGAVFIDEPSEIELETYLMLLAQLRWVLPDGKFPRYMMGLGSNPEPGWVEDRFKDLINETSDKVPSASDGQRIFVRALPRDNPYLPPNWETLMRAKAPKVWVDKYIGGSWEVSEGQLFKEFDRRSHCIALPPRGFLERLKLVASLDHATTGTTCFAIDGIDEDGNVFALASHYQQNRLISEHAGEIKRLMDVWAERCGKSNQVQTFRASSDVHPSYHAFDYVLIDPSTQAKVLQSRAELTSVQDEYRRNGIPTVAAWNAVEAGWNLLQEYIHVRPDHVHPFRQERSSPSFFIVEEFNRDGIVEMIRYKRTVDVRGNVRYIGADHWLDNQRYILMSRPELPVRSTKDVLSMDSGAQKALKAQEKFFKTFGQEPNQNQWFGQGMWN